MNNCRKDEIEWELFKISPYKPKIRTKYEIFKPNLEYLTQTKCLKLRKERMWKLSNFKRDIFLERIRNKSLF